MARGELSSKVRRSILCRLHRRHNGRCTSCRVVTGIPFVMARRGWVIHQATGQLVGPRGELLPMATIEHLTPKAKGGTWNMNNLTLYCQACNWRSAVLGQPTVKVQSEEER